MKDLNEIKFDSKKRTQAGMTVPEGFFEQFQQQLEAKIDTLEALKTPAEVTLPKKSDYRIFRWSIAASVAILIGIGVYVFTSNHSADYLPSQEESSFAQTESQEEEYSMEDMVMRSVNDFELYDLYCEL